MIQIPGEQWSLQREEDGNLVLRSHLRGLDQSVRLFHGQDDSRWFLADSIRLMRNLAQGSRKSYYRALQGLKK